MYGMGLDYALNYAVSHVVVAVGKRGDLFKKVAQKTEEAGECSYPL